MKNFSVCTTLTIDAATVTVTITDLFQRFGLSIGRLRAECYDGASAMSGSRSGAAKRIRDLEPKAFLCIVMVMPLTCQLVTL